MFTSTLIYSNRSHWSLSKHTLMYVNVENNIKSLQKEAKIKPAQRGRKKEEKKNVQRVFLIFPSFIIYSLVLDIHSVNSLRMREGKMPHAWIWHTFFSFLSYPRFSFHQMYTWENDFHSLNAKVRNFFIQSQGRQIFETEKHKILLLIFSALHHQYDFSRKFDAA